LFGDIIEAAQAIHRRRSNRYPKRAVSRGQLNKIDHRIHRLLRVRLRGVERPEKVFIDLQLSNVRIWKG